MFVNSNSNFVSRQKTEEESEYSEYSDLEEEKEEDKQKIVEEEFVLPEVKEEEIEK